MAQLLVCEDWGTSSSWATRLGQELSDDYVVVANPTVHGFPLDAVVVGPQGLFILHVDGTDPLDPWPWEEGNRQQPSSGQRAPRELEERVRSATGALEDFLEDEFPALTPQLHHVLVDAERPLEDDPSGELQTATRDTLAEQIGNTSVPPDGAFSDQDKRLELAVALRDRRLTRSQRTSEPFVFRAGQGLSSGTEVWSIREAVEHMDAHPESGIYHLRNQTLARWLQAEGAEALANLALNVIHQTLDHRAALETFLLGTGLVPRPKLAVRPKQIDLGYVLAGETAARRFLLGKGPGRGYVFGSLEPGAPWLSIDPRDFKSKSGCSDIALRAHTESLAIRDEPHREVIRVHSNASEEPIEIPVQLNVVGEPSPLSRYALRPATGMVSGGLLGAAFGWLLTAWGVPAAELLGRLDWLAGSPRAVWVALSALMWAGFGALRGATQPLAWPIRQTMLRWWSRTGIWVASLGLTGAAARWLWGQRWTAEAGPVPPVTSALMILGPPALAIVPGTIGEIEAGHNKEDTSSRALRWSFLRPLALPAVAVVLATVLGLAGPRLRPLWQRIASPPGETPIGTWLADRWRELERVIQDVIERLYLLYYDV